MTTVRMFAAVTICVSSALPLLADDKAAMLTAQDRAEIQQLSEQYAKTLGMCEAEEYARLFEPEGTFASGFRGSVRGRDRLIALVQSERHCNAAGERRARPAPTVEIQATAQGAVGRGTVGHDGTYYDDVYIKTPAGWRFKLRQVVTGTEKAAGLTGQDFLAIRRLAGEGDPAHGDLYSSTPEGWRFRSSGVVIAATPAGVTGRVHLKDGGRYDDVYERAPNGWRFRSRTFVAEVPAGADGAAQQVR